MKSPFRYTALMMLNFIPLLRLMWLHPIHEKSEEMFVTDPDKPVTDLPNLQEEHSLCASWDKNMDDWWTSHPDWSLSSENDTHYCFSPMEDKAKAKFFRRLHDIQHHGDCSNMVVKELWSSGWGADFLNINDGLIHALDAKQPVQMHTHSHWHYAANKENGSHAACPKKDLSCFFLNMSSCEVPDDLPREKVVNALLATKYSLHIHELMSSWAYEYATRPQSWLRRAVYEYSTKSANLSTPCAAMHVRRGDVVLHGNWSRKYHEIHEYIDAATERNRSLHKDERSIFLLTDDQNAIEEASSQFPDYNWVFLDRPRHRGAEGGWESQTPSNDPKQEVIIMLSIFRLVQQCDTLIHSTSNFADYLWHYMSDSVKINIDDGKSDVYGAHNFKEVVTPN